MRRSEMLTVIALIVVTVLLTAGFVGGGPTARSQGSPLAVMNGRLFDGTGAPPIEDGVVLIEGNRIVAAGPADEVAVPAYAVTIDAAGGLIMPGVIDSHAHVILPVEQQNDIFTPWLRSGVTTVVDNGTRPELTATLRSLVEEVAEEAPRLFVAGPMLTAPDGYPFSVPALAFIGQEVTSPEDAQARVADLIDQQGADLIKVSIEAGFGADLDNPEWPVLPPETLAAIAEAAHQRGIIVRAHVTHPQELQAALEAGFDVAAHMPIVPLPDELLQQAADAGMILVSTAANFYSGVFGPSVAENVSRYAELGGPVALGTDGIPEPQMPLQEMEILVEGGLSPTEVLLAATKHGAEAVGWGDELGTLAPGKLADVIVVVGDPLSNIAAMANVSVVIRDGEIVLEEVPSLPDSGRGPANEDNSLWPALVVAFVAAGALLAGGGLLVARRR